MDCFYLSSITIWILIIVIHLNILSVTSKLVSIQKGDPTEWREYGEKANFVKFNSIYTISINEELLNNNRYSSGRCDNLNPWNRNWAAYYLSYPNTCRGSIHYCWFKAKTEKRKALEERLADIKNARYITLDAYFMSYLFTQEEEVKNLLNYAGNDCYCLCERYYNYENNPRGDLLDSICYDPVSVDDGYVATGVRFKRHSNIVYLELQQGILSAGRIDPNTLMWKSSDNCSSAEKVVYNRRKYPTSSPTSASGGTSNYDSFDMFMRTIFLPLFKLYRDPAVILEDMTLPESAVVTGITFGKSLRGRYVNDNGDFTENVDDIVKESQCSERVPELTTDSVNYLLPTSLVGRNNELSKSCEHKIQFHGSKEGTDSIQHIVPYIDLQEIVTDQNAPKPLRGIGWYYRSHPGYGGFLALKIFE